MANIYKQIELCNLSDLKNYIKIFYLSNPCCTNFLFLNFIELENLIANGIRRK